MLKRFEKIAICVFLAALMLTGCSTKIKDTSGSTAIDSDGWFFRINDTPMVYNRETRIMYYLFNRAAGYNGYGYMSPYYNEHGQMCYYVDGQIIPIEEALMDVD